MSKKNIYQKLYNEVTTSESRFSDYIDAADVARVIRHILKAEFPGQKFSVRTKKYSGGASVRVSWTDGPLEKDVKEHIEYLEGKSFDGMIDMATYRRHWLTPQGITFAESPGTTGSRGTIPPSEAPKPSDNAVLVHPMADYIFTSRDFSDELVESILDEVNQDWGWSITLDKWRGGLSDNEKYREVWGRLGETSAYTPPAAPSNASPANGAGADDFSITHDRDWTWIHFPGKPAADVRDALKSLGARWSRKREAWYIRENVEKSTILATIG